MSGIPSATSTQLKTKDGLGWGIIGVFWAALWIIRHPAPTTDDLWFIGAAFNLADGRAFVNPYCTNMSMAGGQDHFFVYTPLHSFVLAGWIKLFGLSATTMTIFQVVMDIWASVALWHVMRGTGTGLFLRTGICVAVLVLVSSAGLRPDAMRLTAFALGGWILRDSSRLAWAACSCCLWLSAITSPSYAFFVVFVVGGALANLIWPRRMPWREMAIRVGLAVATGFAVALLFLYLIQFLLLEFLNDMHLSANTASGYAIMGHIRGTWGHPIAQLHLSVHVFAPLLILLAIVGLFFCLRKSPQRSLRSDWIRRGCRRDDLRLYPRNDFRRRWTPAHFLLRHGCALLSGARSAPTSGGGIAAWASFVILSVSMQGRYLIQFCIQQFAPVKVDAAAIRRQVEALNGDQVFVDGNALRTVYDYRLPPGVFDYHFSAPKFMPTPAPEEFSPNSVFVVSTSTVEFMGTGRTFVAGIPRPHNGLIRTLFPWTVENADEFYVISTSPSGKISKVIPMLPASSRN